MKKENSPSFCVYVCTYKRPMLLYSLLHSISNSAAISDNYVAIHIIDNDNDRSAETVSRDKFKNSELKYSCEPLAGVVNARNRAIECFSATAFDYMVFVDDDQTVDPDWISNIVYSIGSEIGDVYVGPVNPKKSNLHAEYDYSQYFNRDDHKDKEELEFFWNGNVIFSRRAINLLDKYDIQFNFTGGEDTEASLRLRKAGCRIIFAKKLICYEDMDPERLKRKWMIKRKLNNGKILGKIHTKHSRNISIRLARCLIKLVLRAVWCYVKPLDSEHRFKNQLQIFEAYGEISELLLFRTKNAFRRS